MTGKQTDRHKQMGSDKLGMELIGACADFKITKFPFLYHYLIYSIVIDMIGKRIRFF